MTGATPNTPAGWVTPRKLYAAAAIICSSICALAGFSLWTHFKSFEASAVERVELYARVLEDQVNRTFNSADATMQAVTDTLSSYTKQPPSSLNSLLNQQIQKTAFLRSLSITDDTGKVIASSNSDNINLQLNFPQLGIIGANTSELETTSLSNKTQLGATVAGRDLVDSTMTLGQPSRFTFVPYSQPISVPTATQAKSGWILATINPDFFANQHALLLDSDNRSASMLHMQGAYIASTSETTFKSAQQALLHPFFTKFLPSKESGNIIGNGLMGNKVISAFRTARNQPIVLVVEESYVFATQPFQTTLQLTLAVVAVLLILIVALTRGAVGSLRQHVNTIRIELEKQQTLLAMEDLKAQQTQLIQTEKIASLSLLVANVAHEINTPIGAIKSSASLIGDAIKDAFAQLPLLLSRLSPQDQALFNQFIQNYPSTTPALSTRDERNITRKITQQLQDAGVEANQTMGRLLLQFGAHNSVLQYQPLLQHAESELIIQTASNIAATLNGSNNINAAVERVSRIIFALKEFSSADKGGEKMPLDLRTSIEEVFVKYKSQMLPDFMIERNYDDMPPLPCLPEEIKQTCAHIIHNAFLAMHFQGTLNVSLKLIDNHAVISVKDSGCGIRDDQLPRIFDAFFTTRSSGEGSGLGLAVVKKIIDKHAGRMEVQSQIGLGTTFTIYLPYP